MKSTFGLVCEGFAIHGKLEFCQLSSGDGTTVESRAGWGQEDSTVCGRSVWPWRAVGGG